MPSQVFTLQFRIVNGYIFGIPERIFRVDYGITYFYILTILERIVSLLAIIFDTYIFAVHKQIVCMSHFHVFQFHVPAVPKRFLCIRNAYPLQPDTIHFTKHFRRFNQSICHFQITRIPQSGTGAFGKQTVFHHKAVNVPKRIFPFKPTSYCLNVRTFF